MPAGSSIASLCPRPATTTRSTCAKCSPIAKRKPALATHVHVDDAEARIGQRRADTGPRPVRPALVQAVGCEYCGRSVTDDAVEQNRARSGQLGHVNSRAPWPQRVILKII
jgi:hypothetical protein